MLSTYILLALFAHVLFGAELHTFRNFTSSAIALLTSLWHSKGPGAEVLLFVDQEVNLATEIRPWTTALLMRVFFFA